MVSVRESIPIPRFTLTISDTVPAQANRPTKPKIQQKTDKSTIHTTEDKKKHTPWRSAAALPLNLDRSAGWSLRCP